MKKRRLLAVGGVLAAAVLTLAGCGAPAQSSAASQQLYGGTLKVASVGDVDALDPLIAYSAESWGVIRATTRQLVTYPGSKEGIGRDTQVVPDLATSWEVSDDGLTYTFHLRDGVKFSGASTRPITAKDFVYAIKRFPDPNANASAITYYNATLKGFADYGKEFAKVKTGDLAASKTFIDTHEIPGVKAVNDQTLQFTLTKPTSDFLDILTLPFVTPLPEEVTSNYFADGLEFRQHYVSSGPYEISKYDPNKQLVLSRVKGYNSDGDPRKAYADEIDFDTTVASADAASQQIQAGTADLGLYIRAYPANVVQQYLKTDPDHIHKSESGSALFVSWNNSGSPATDAQSAFRDLKVRQAFTYALNRADVVRGLGGENAARPSNEILTSTITGYTGQAAYPTDGDKGDPDKATQLLQESGHSGLTASLAYMNNPEQEKVATSIQTAVKRSGITLKLVPVAAEGWSAYNSFLSDKSKAGQWDLALASWTPDWQGNSARMTLGGWLDSDFAPGGTWNGVTYDNARLNRLAEDAIVAKDPEPQWQQANQLASEDLAWFPLIERVKSLPTSSRVTNWTWQSLGNGPDITNISVKGQ